MARIFETGEITKLLDVLIGKTEAVGETNEDKRRLDNLKTLIDVTNWCLDGLQFAMASGYGRPEYSMAEISYTAQCALDEYGRWIADVLDEQIADRKTEPQKKEVEWVYNKPERLWYPYSNGELLFKTENSSEKPNNCECGPRKEQNFCGKCRYLYRDFKYGLSCYRLMDNEPCKYEARKTEDSSMVDKDINVRSKDCETCKHYKLACELFSEICKYEPTTQTETQNSNSTFEKDECVKEYEELGLKELKELIEADRKTEQMEREGE